MEHDKTEKNEQALDKSWHSKKRRSSDRDG